MLECSNLAQIFTLKKSGAGMFFRSKGEGHRVNKCKNTFLVITLAAVVNSQIYGLQAKLGASLHLPRV